MRKHYGESEPIGRARGWDTGSGKGGEGTFQGQGLGDNLEVGMNVL